MIKKTSWFLFAFLAIGIGLYPLMYFTRDSRFGLLTTKTEELLASSVWNTGFYIHIILGGIAMLVGWTQFSPWIRKHYLNIHRSLGKIYVISALTAGLAGFYIAWHATGGIVSSLGFGALAVLWVSSTLSAYIAVRRKDLRRHEIAMIFSYAFCFAAVTLRLWMPLLIYLIGDFITAYRIVAWLCWIPNLIFALVYTRKLDQRTTPV